jgi:hypothetical protein
LKSRNTNNGDEEAQEELKKEGAGARKKSRLMGARENIGDANWMDAIPESSGNVSHKTFEVYGKVVWMVCLECCADWFQESQGMMRMFPHCQQRIACRIILQVLRTS